MRQQGRWNASQLKWIAMVTMMLDHIGAVFNLYLYLGTPLEPILYTAYAGWLRWVGRLSFPIFAFLLARGCDKTRSLGRYALRLAIFGFLSQVPYTLALSNGNFLRIGAPETFPLQVWDWSKLNIFFTLLLGLAAIALWKQSEQGKLPWFWRAAAVFILVLAGVIPGVDYGALGVLLIFCLWKFPSKFGTAATVVAFGFLNHMVSWDALSSLSLTSVRALGRSVGKVFPWAAHFSLNTWAMFLMVCASLVFLLRYNGERGNQRRWTGYVFYPAHLLALALIREIGILLG
jgi:hypothetical protein